MEAHPVDIHVGKKLRSRRTILGRSQEEIGKAVGITFQQVQKYERGLNRIGSSRLYEFAKLLGVNISYFFDTIESSSPAPLKSLSNSAIQNFAENADNNDGDIIDNKEILGLVRSYYAIGNPQVRKKILSLIKTLSSVKETDEDTAEINYNKVPVNA